MNKTEAHDLIVRELDNIAPETDFDAIDATADLREELDIDSLDFLNFITAVHKKTGVNVPETDYQKLLTLDGAISYLVEKTG
jgi:acyl carrier protein